MKYLKIYEECRLIKGANRCLIAEMNRYKFFFIPISMYELLLESNNRSVESMYEEYAEQREVLDEYLQFLEENDFIFYCDSKEEADCFPKLSLDWDYPARISNAVLEIDQMDESVVFDSIAQLETMGCRLLKLIFYGSGRAGLMDRVLNRLQQSTILEINIDAAFDAHADPEPFFTTLMATHKRLLKVGIFQSPFNKVSSLPIEQDILGSLLFSTQPLSNKNCGQVNYGYFTTNIEHYTESISHNTCLNRKVAIDDQGNIRNCPSMSKSFGNVRDVALSEIIAGPEFRKYWNINKDQIQVCKDCEFRHICTDCRAYVEAPGNDFSKPLKCGYDPYTNEWSEWSTNPLKRQAIETYGMQDLILRSGRP